MTLRLLVLVSGSGTLLQALLDAQAFGRLDAAVVAVGADRACTGLERAAAAGVPTFTVRLGDHRDAEGAVDRASFDEALTRACAEHDPDLIVSAGFMKLVGEAFLARFGGRMINTHPALLPSFPGAHGVRDAPAHAGRAARRWRRRAGAEAASRRAQYPPVVRAGRHQPFLTHCR